MKEYYIVKVNEKEEKFDSLANAKKVYSKAKNDKDIFCGWLISATESKKLFTKKVDKFVIDNFWNA